MSTFVVNFLPNFAKHGKNKSSIVLYCIITHKFFTFVYYQGYILIILVLSLIEIKADFFIE